MKKSDLNTFRRKKIIEENSPNKKANDLANSQLDKLGDIGNKIDQNQAAIELVSETIENKSNQIIDSVSDVSDYTQQVNDNTDLIVDSSQRSSESLSKINSAADLINEKLSKLAELLSNKTDVQTDASKTPGTSVSTVSDAIPEPVTQPSLEELLERLLPKNDNNPDADFNPPERNENNETEEQKKIGDKTKSDKESNDKLASIAKGINWGFKKSISLTDKISNMLFSYTVTAIAQMAKTAAMILGIVMLADIIKVNFKYWSELFQTNFEKFSEKAKEWGPLLTAIVEAVNSVKDAWEKGDWGGLAEAIVKGLLNVINSLGETIMLGMSKALAGMLRALHMDESADNIEGGAIDRFQYRTGARLSEEDQDKRAKYVDKQEQEEANMSPTKRKALAFYKYHTGQITEEEYNNARDGKNVVKKDYADKPEEERIQIIKSRQAAEAEMKRTTDYVKNTKPEDEGRLKSANDAVDKAKESVEKLNTVSPDSAKDLKDELKNLESMLKDKTIEKPEAIPAAEQPEAKQTNAINKKDERKSTDYLDGAGQTNAVINTNINKTNNNIFKMPPQTSTAAPGMHGLNKTN